MSDFLLGCLVGEVLMCVRVRARLPIVSQVRGDSGVMRGEMIAALIPHLDGERRSSDRVYSWSDLVRFFF